MRKVKEITEAAQLKADQKKEKMKKEQKLKNADEKSSDLTELEKKEEKLNE